MNLKKMPLVLAALALVLTLVITGCKSEPDDPEQYTVTFNALGGTVEGSTVSVEIKVESGKTIGELPVPVNSSSNFWGWFTSDGSGGGDWGNIFDETSKVTKNITVYARWETTVKPSQQYTVTFNAAGGSPATTTLTVLGGDTCTPPIPTRSSYNFSGWYTGQNGGGTLFTNTTSVTANITVYALWRSADDPSLGETLILQGPVYQEERSQDTGEVSYTEYKGTHEFDDWEIVDGNLSAEFSVANVYLATVENYWWYSDNLKNQYTTLSLSDPTAKIAQKEGLGADDDEYGYWLKRSNATSPVIDTNNKTFTFTDEDVEYLYVDKDLTISGTGKELPGEGSPAGTLTTEDFSLELKKGWNAIYTKTSSSGSFISMDDPETMTFSSTAKMELKNPANLRWVLDIEKKNQP